MNNMSTLILIKIDTLRRLIVGYNHSFRMITNYPRHRSASGMFVYNDVFSFRELWRKSIFGFRQRVDNCLNKVVIVVRNSTFLCSELRKQWRVRIAYFAGDVAPATLYCVYLA